MEKHMNRLWRLWFDALVGSATALMLSGGIMSIVVTNAGPRQRNAVDIALDDILTNPAVNYTVIIAVLIALVYAFLIFAMRKRKQLVCTVRMTGHIEDSIMIPVIFEAVSIFQDDIFKSVAVTILYTAVLAVIVFNMAFEIGFVNYFINEIAGND